MLSETTVFFTGILIGTTLLVIGLAIGWFLGRRATPAASAPTESFEQRQVLDFIRNFAAWTNDFAGDFSRYQAKLTSLSETAEQKVTDGTKDDVKQLIGEILSANRSLQSRLDQAEVRLEQQTRELSEYLTEARTDALTGLSNRRAFDQSMDEQFKLFREKKAVFCLALLDIDFFKSINDNCGHPAGDAVLIEIASRLKQFAGDNFKVGRYGGEEFAVLIPVPIKTAAQHIDRLRKSMADQPVVIENESLRVTVSCGVAEVQVDERLGGLFRRTDEALYSAKIGGRNRVYIHNGIICEPFGNPGAPEVARFGKPAGRDQNVENDPHKATREKLQTRFDQLVAKELNRQSK